MKLGLKKSKLLRGLKHYASLKAVRKKIGLTGKSRHFRQIKRSFKGLLDRGKSYLAYDQPVSASTVGYQHQAKTLSQMTGGV